MNDLHNINGYYVKKNAYIVARKIHDIYILINITDNNVGDICLLYQINETGYYIWNNIDGKQTCTELAYRLWKTIEEEIDYQTVFEDVLEFLDELNKRGFVEVLK